MNRSGYQKRIAPTLMISGIFLVVILAFLWSASRYWSQVLQPRLQMAAESHAEVLANAQAASLLPLLGRPGPEQQRALDGKLQEMLLLTDPSVEEPFFRAASLMFDYELLPVPTGSLDLTEGNPDCDQCYAVEVPLTRDNEVLGLATLWVTDAYYRRLSGDMQSRLYAELSLTLVLLTGVWLTILVLYLRLQNAKDQLESSDRAKTRFLANVSHELRTPLNAILGYTQLYKRNKPLMQEYGQGIDTIDRSADHLLLMINDILDFSRAESDRIELLARTFSLPEFLGQLVEMSRIRAHLKDIAFVHEFADDLPQRVSCDEKRLRQVLLNLLNNAVKFTASGKVEFSVTRAPDQRGVGDGHQRLRFAIRDTGPGIAAAQQEEIFLPFRQLDNSSGEGSGLGLAISRSLVQLMGARLRLDSTVGQGSCFWFDVVMPVVTGAARVARFSAGDVCGYSGEPRHVLSVDDNALNRDVLHQRLAALGFTVSDAASGSEALALLEQQKVDLVLLDLLMPEQDGFAVLEQIRRRFSASELPVIAMTAAIRTEVESRARESGFDAVLIKPVRDDELLPVLAKALALHWRYEHAPQKPQPGKQPVQLPEPSFLAALLRCAEQHDVLGIRRQLEELESDPTMEPFVQQVQSFLRGYQFGQLVSWLESVGLQEAGKKSRDQH